MTTKSGHVLFGVVAILAASHLVACVGDAPSVEQPSGPADTTPDSSTPVAEDSGTPDVSTIPDTSVVIQDRNCADAKARLKTATDGVVWIDPDLAGPTHKPFEVFCAGMSTAAPKEYLELKRTSSPSAVTSNYSTNAGGIPHNLWKCGCGPITAVYSKVRIEPVSLMLDVGDRTFAVFATSTKISCIQDPANECPGAPPFSLAQSCTGGEDTSGRANVDLRDMPFHVAGTGNDLSMFKKNEELVPVTGFRSAGEATIDAERKVVNLKGGGDCGGYGASTGLKLAQDL